MSIAKAVVAFLLLLIVAACSNAGPVSASLDEPFTLAVEQSTTLDEGLTLTFDSVLEDSRCPSQVTCAEAGFARILLEATLSDEEPLTYELNTQPTFELGEITHGPYTIQLMDLAPYPETPEALPASDEYRLTLVVSKK